MSLAKPAAWAALASVLLGLAVLPACSKGGGNATGRQSGATAPASGPDVTVNAADMPHLKAGYWEAVTITNGRASEPHRFCSSGKPAPPPIQMGRGCAAFSFKRSFMGSYVMEADCAEGPVASKMRLTASGDFNSSYVTDGQVSITMQGRPASNFATHTVTRYVGPCPAGAATDD